MNCLTFHKKNKDIVLAAFAVEQHSIISKSRMIQSLIKLVDELCCIY